MAEAQTVNAESGTTLAELLVAMAILLILGSITTVGLVQGFSAQLTAANVAETLDGTRIATQRVRDFVRAADEVCANSTPTNLVLWTDDDRDGIPTDDELDIFELVNDSGIEVFQRRTPGPSGDEQLIRDDIINDALFSYDTPPAAQPNDLRCKQGVVMSGGANPIRVVDVSFTVENPDPADDDLTTATSVRLRNSGLIEGAENDPPDASFTHACPQPDRRCTFDATGSTDPDGTISSYDWTFTDGAGAVVGTRNGVTPSFPFDTGNVPYDVTLLVTDDDGATDTFAQSVTPVAEGTNPPPTAAFVVEYCTGRTCKFDASSSSDDVGITSYSWEFGTAGTASGVSPAPFTFPASGSYTVRLTVVDTDGASSSVEQLVTANEDSIYVLSLTAAKVAGNLDATVTLKRSTSGSPKEGTLVTFDFKQKNGNVTTATCTTTVTNPGRCTTSNVSFPNGQYPVTITVKSVTNTGPYVYAPSLNDDDTEVVP